jgi:Domain of unknown function (DUF4351)
MSQFPHDRLNKNLLELRLSPFGEIKIQKSIDPETTFIDIHFIPQKPIPPEAQLGLLAQCVGNQTFDPLKISPVAFEPYRDPVDIDEIQGCIIKALEMQKEVFPKPDAQAQYPPRMWIITPTLAQHKLTKFGAVSSEAVWGKGVYLLPEAIQTGIILVHQLPVIPETRWFRLMGKGRVQRAAIAEIAALPVGHPDRANTLDLLVSYTMELTAKLNTVPEEQELMMQLSPLYLEKLEAVRQESELKGVQDFVLRKLTRQIGQVSVDLESQIRRLSLTELESLGDALLGFRQMGDLLEWLQNLQSGSVDGN